jgi:hypothetical protein
MLLSRRCSMPYRLEGNQPEKLADALLAEG